MSGLVQYSLVLSASIDVCLMYTFPLSVLHPSAQKRRMTTSQARTAPTSQIAGTNRPSLFTSNQWRNDREQNMSSAGQTAMIQMNQAHKNHNRLLVHMVRERELFQLSVVRILSDTLIYSVLRFVLKVKSYDVFSLKGERSLVCLQFPTCGSVKMTYLLCALWFQVQLFKRWEEV